MFLESYVIICWDVMGLIFTSSLLCSYRVIWYKENIVLLDEFDRFKLFISLIDKIYEGSIFLF
jgi:hypothetical protein